MVGLAYMLMERLLLVLLYDLMPLFPSAATNDRH